MWVKRQIYLKYIFHNAQTIELFPFYDYTVYDKKNLFSFCIHFVISEQN